nr:Ndr [Hymenolepis microstoma]
MAALGMASEQHYDLELPIGKVNVYIQGNLASRNVVFLTVHDLGCNHYQYEEFVAHPKMRPISERAVWVSVDLPGQGDGEEELPASYTFPTLWNIAGGLKNVLDHFNIEHVVLFGEGAGANILARFAMLHDEMVMGAVLVHCTGQTASFADSLRDKLINWKLKTTGMNPATESFLILHRFGCLTDTGTELELKQAIEHFRENLQHSINAKNLNGYITAYMQRKPLSERLCDLKCSVLLITGALAPQRKGCEKLYESLMKVQGATSSCATRELVVVENVANVLAERPDKVIESMQYFLQGIGLVSHLKMQTTPLNLNRRMSMEDYDKPMGRVQLAGGFRPNLTAPSDVPEENNN